MRDVELSRVGDDGMQELNCKAVRLDQHLQRFIENHLDTFLHVGLVASEHSMVETHAGRINMLGLDENFCPTVFDYKRNSNANVINQGLFHLGWLMNHEADFGQKAADQLDWSAPRPLCIAEDFTRYDIHAIQHVNRNIELQRYILFVDDLPLLDLVNVVSAKPLIQRSFEEN